MFSDYDNEEPELPTESDGELKKRLVALMEEGNFEYIGTAETIIDEAKKEYLDIIYHKTSDKHPLQTVNGQIVDLRKQWFNKWFGEK